MVTPSELLESLQALVTEQSQRWHPQSHTGEAVHAILSKLSALIARHEPDPETAARERLGRWLASKPRRTYRKYPPSLSTVDEWLIVLIHLDAPIAGNIEAWGNTFAEAINAALDAAESEER